MFLIYSLILSVGFLIMSPLFILRRQKYASGFRQRLGNYPAFLNDGRRVIWLHCVSVGEANAARPLADRIRSAFPGHRLVISTTTATGHELAKQAFAEKADAVFYFPFDWKFSVKRALDVYKPAAVLLMETEIWPRFIHEAKRSGAKVMIVNGRLSERSAARYALAKPFIRRVLGELDLALMQGEKDAERLNSLGMERLRTEVTGNVKFDVGLAQSEEASAAEIARRFGLDGKRPLIAAASTHEPEERWMLEAYCSVASDELPQRPRLLIAPRHPERFDAIAALIRNFINDPACEWSSYTFARRSGPESAGDATADVILLDSIGELRSVYQFAEIVFVGGSLVPHGGQSILEPAAAGKAIITGSHTFNFTDVITVFAERKAVIRIPDNTPAVIVDDLFLNISDMLEERELIAELGQNAKAVMDANRGAADRTVSRLRMTII